MEVQKEKVAYCTKKQAQDRWKHGRLPNHIQWRQKSLSHKCVEKAEWDAIQASQEQLWTNKPGWDELLSRHIQWRQKYWA
eukprot:16443729-Heterocapsa_arctica.AAC.1